MLAKALMFVLGTGFALLGWKMAVSHGLNQPLVAGAGAVVGAVLGLLAGTARGREYLFRLFGEEFKRRTS